MSAQNEEGVRPEENKNQEIHRGLEHHSEGILSTHVLETMRNLIVELQLFKSYDEKLKKDEEDQLEIIEIFLCSIVTKKIPKDNEREGEVSKNSWSISSHETEK